MRNRIHDRSGHDRSTCTIINYPTFIELNQLGQQINIQTSGNKTRTYNGSEIRMIGYTNLIL